MQTGTRTCASGCGSAAGRLLQRSIGSLMLRFLRLRVPRQRRLQRSQPGFVMPPLVNALAVDRPANLFGAGSMDAAFGLVKFNAGRLEVQFAELEDPPNAAFEVIENVLVLYTQHLSREYAIPMLHEIDVGSVIARDILEAVGELLAGRK